MAVNIYQALPAAHRPTKNPAIDSSCVALSADTIAASALSSTYNPIHSALTSSAASVSSGSWNRYNSVKCATQEGHGEQALVPRSEHDLGRPNSISGSE